MCYAHPFTRQNNQAESKGKEKMILFLCSRHMQHSSLPSSMYSCRKPLLHKNHNNNYTSSVNKIVDGDNWRDL